MTVGRDPTPGGADPTPEGRVVGTPRGGRVSPHPEGEESVRRGRNVTPGRGRGAPPEVGQLVS